LSDRYDVIVVGSGPIGAAFARVIGHALRSASILMVDAGPVLTEPPGLNVRNLTDLDERRRVQALAQGRTPQPPPPAGAPPVGVYARPGTHLVRLPEADADPHDGMPGAAMSTNVGGMGAHWTCACPEPAGRERIGFVGAREWQAALTTACRFLAVTPDGFAPNSTSARVREALGMAFAPLLDPRRPVGPMPLACVPGRGRPRWSGTDTVLDGLLPAAGAPGLSVRPETLCRKIVADRDRARAVVLEDLAGGAVETVEAAVVFVAGDAFRSPQLLHASGIRPPALGRYLNDQPQVIAASYVPDLDADVAADVTAPVHPHVASGVEDRRDNLTGVSWVPYSDPDHPFHGQVMQLDASPIDLGVDADGGAVVGLGWFCAKDIRAEDRVEFSGSQTDDYGMPAIRIEYGLSDRDRANLELAIAHERRAAAALGGFAPNGEPVVLPSGSSLHYQGTVRMGDDGGENSVCDRDSRVWGFRNLFVGGNGVIPTAIACNPTLTSVALAVLAAQAAGAKL